MEDRLFYGTIHELGGLLRRREVSSEEITRAVLARIEAVEDRVQSYITLAPEAALDQARRADEDLAAGRYHGSLHGIPIAVKDVLATRGVRTTCGSRLLESFVPPYDATVIRRLREAGAVLVGKTNMDEFAMGSTTQTSHFKTSRNPWDLDRVAGGSSGGSASAVAAGEAIAALGSDTGGSIRQPASFCGIVGLKPTYGTVSRFGLVAFASSLDQVGPMTRSVRDCAILLEAISGRDPFDSTSIDRPVPPLAERLADGVKGMRIGVPREYFAEGLDAGVEAAVRAAVRTIEKMGAEIVEVSLPHTEYAVATYYVIAPAEASSNLARYDGIKYGHRSHGIPDLIETYRATRTEGFGAECKRRIIIGTYVLSAGYYDAYYRKAMQVRTLIRRDFEQAFRLCDAIVTPVCPTPAFRLGEKMDNPLRMYLSDVYTISLNLAGLPGLSVPCGLSSDALPIGMQLIGPAFAEETILKLAYAYEQATPWHTLRPKLTPARGEGGGADAHRSTSAGNGSRATEAGSPSPSSGSGEEPGKRGR